MPRHESKSSESQTTEWTKSGASNGPVQSHLSKSVRNIAMSGRPRAAPVDRGNEICDMTRDGGRVLLHQVVTRAVNLSDNVDAEWCDSS